MKHPSDSALSRVRAPELLAPAGNWDCVRAAAANGADAVYFGLSAFNARMRAENFTLDDLPELVGFLHARGMRAHVTLNTLVFTSELDEAERFLAALEEAGVDVVIVQDLGVARLARAIAPGVAVHGSTQMTITSPEGARFAARLGVSQAVLARELSLREIADFAEQPLPVEVFVHGALCVAYSGQCLTSESLGQRSANRGECAQACRQPYELIVDGALAELGERRFLLSPQDLAALDEIPELLRLGVRTLKIEGRLKSAEYVAAVSSVYRRAIDAATGGGSREEARSTGADDRYLLESVFSRGLFSGWLRGDDHQTLVHARYGKKRGPLVGRVGCVHRDHVELDVDPPEFLRAGDGLVFDSGGDTEHEEGGRLWELSGRALRFENGRIDFGRLAPGDRVWKTDDPRLRRELRRSFSGETAGRRRGIDLVVRGEIGRPLELECELDGRVHRVASRAALEPARSRGIDETLLRSKLGRLGDTPFELGTIGTEIPADAAIPVSELNRMRRALVDLLLRARRAVDGGRHATRGVVPRELARIRSAQRTAEATPGLGVLCRSLEQLEAVLELDVTRVLVDFEDIRRFGDAVRIARNAPVVELFLATPRIQKSGERGFFNAIERHADAGGAGVLLRNLGALEFFRERPIRRAGDYSLNVANPLTADILLEEGLEWLTASYDLDAGQLVDLLEGSPTGVFDVTIHQHMPMFHMAHCVFAAFLSDGKDHTDCGHPCDRHRLELRDHVGASHPVHADVGCRNTVFNSRAQSGAKFHRAFARAGAGSLRVELLDEDADGARRVIRAYRRLLDGELPASELVRELRLESKLGVTLGTLRVASGSDAP